MTTNRFPTVHEFANANGDRYRPGGDAQHVSALLTALKTNAIVPDGERRGQIADVDLDDAAKMLLSTALQVKLRRAVARHNEGPKSRAKAPATPAQPPMTATDGNGIEEDAIRWHEVADVKVGRWFYPAREVTTESGQAIVRNTQRDGLGKWIEHEVIN